MIFNGKEVEFPAIGKVSFFKVYESLEKMVKEGDKVYLLPTLPSDDASSPADPRSPADEAESGPVRRPK